MMETTMLVKDAARRAYILLKLRKHNISYHSLKTPAKNPKMVYVEWKTPEDLKDLFETQIEKNQLEVQGKFIQATLGA